ncbi:MAG: CoA transferase [Actinobacteria bacterium]|nr:CoA transferase [Actinomycetota bacterium]
MPLALDGVRVLDFSRVLAGPLATMVLADHGATVVKIERPGAGDDTRAWGPPYDADGTATYFLSVNRNKRSLALDLADPDDLATAHALAARADVVIENFRPGVMERLGLDRATLAAANPRLVTCSITGFGCTEGAALPGYDLLVQAVGGLMSVTGAPGGQPQKVGVALVDVVTGLFAATGILAALRHRDATGEGQHVETDLLTCLLAGLVNQASGFTAAGVVPQRIGNAHPSIAPYELFEAADGPLAIAVGTDRQFAALCDAIGAPELAGDPRFATNPARVAARAALRERIETCLRTRPAAAWAEALLAVGVPAGQVNDVGEAFAFAQRLGLDPVAELHGADGRTTRVPRHPVRLSATPPRHELPPPALGELAREEALRLFGA